jgi:hypothetical protein
MDTSMYIVTSPSSAAGNSWPRSPSPLTNSSLAGWGWITWRFPPRRFGSTPPGSRAARRPAAHRPSTARRCSHRSIRWRPTRWPTRTRSRTVLNAVRWSAAGGPFDAALLQTIPVTDTQTAVTVSAQGLVETAVTQSQTQVDCSCSWAWTPPVGLTR